MDVTDRTLEPTPPGRGVLVVYTGGTIGSVRANPANPDDPLVPGSVEQLKANLPLVEGSRMRYGNRLVPIDLVRFEPLLDSTMIKPADWIRIASYIEESYDRFEGFVVLHGTDTMAFTASALAFMFENLDRPIVITGSQRPIGEIRSDAVQNVVTAVEVAAARSLGGEVVPEVTVFFRDQLLRGCRVTKRSADDYHAFHTPSLPPLGVAGDQIEIAGSQVRPAAGGPLRVHKELDQNIAVLELSPLMSYDMFERLLGTGDLHAVILRTYGTGNAPTDDRFLEIVRGAVARGVRIVAVTQCTAGTVELGLYKASVGLLEAGVISGMDMTSEAAQTKMAVLLADRTRTDRVEDLMSIDLRGELDRSLFDLRFPGGEAAPVGTVWQTEPFPAPGRFRKDRIRGAKLRIFGLEVPEGAPEVVDLTVSINDPRAVPGARPPRDAVSLGGILCDPAVQWGKTVFLDVGGAVSRSVDPGRRSSVTVVSRSGQPLRWKSMSVAIFLG